MKRRSDGSARHVSIPDSRQRGARTDKGPAAAAGETRLKDPTVCDLCGAIYTRKTWRFDHAITEALLEKASWELCPACVQEERKIAYGRLLLKGAYVREHEAAIRQRKANVADRAAHTQPQRRVISVGWDGGVLEVLTTSQKLAHRIATELKKAFGGRTTYSWAAKDGTLFASWTR